MRCAEQDQPDAQGKDRTGEQDEDELRLGFLRKLCPQLGSDAGTDSK